MPDQFLFEGFVLAGSTDDGFADFYRAHVRYQRGERLTAADLRAAYAAWAEKHDAPPASARAISAMMQANGHVASKSSSVYYRDAVLGDFAGQAPSARALPIVDGRPVKEALAVTVGDIDAIMAELEGIKRRLNRLMPSPSAARGGKR